MKKITLFLIATLFSAMSFAELNPYAYGLSSEPNADQTELTVNYSLNATATNVDFVLLDGDKVIKTVNLNDKGLDKGTYTADIALDDPNMPLGKKLTWKLEVKGAAHNTTNNHGGYQFYHPSGVDIDNNPESKHFGRILCNEAMQSVASKTEKYRSAGFGAGIYAFTPAFEPIDNGDKPGFNGGNTFVNTHTLYGSKAQTAYVTRRIRISDDGRIFVTSLNPTQNAYLWEVNPDNLDEWTPVFEYTKKSSYYDLVDASGNFIAGPNVGFDVRGSGRDLKLLMLSANINGMQANQNFFTCSEYNLGENKKWNTTPSKEIKFKQKYAISFTGCQVQYDNEGGIWFTQNRGTSTDAQPALVHINALGVEDYKEKIDNLKNAGFCFNKDFTKVIIADGRNTAGTARYDGYARIYNISKDANGIPVLTLWKYISMVDMGASLNDFAWDIADNVYAVSNSGEWIRAYALARTADDIATTPCASKYAFTINSAAQMAKASELNPYAYNLSSVLSDDKKTLTINYSLNANATAVKVIIMEGDTEVKTVACTGIIRGEHTIEIPTIDLPVGPKFTWKIKVDGTSKDKPTQVSTYYSLYCPHGLAIDKNPESEYFGRILAAEGMDAVPATGYLSSGQGGGLYVFNPDFSTDGKVRNGGKDFTRQWASYGYQPWRVKISEDGRIFVSSCDLNGKFVWELSKDLNTWTEVLARGQEKSSSTMKGNAFTTDEGLFLAGMNLSMDVIGSGKDLKLLLYSASGTGITGQTQSLFRLDEYALGEATKWDNSKEPTQITCFSGKYGSMYNNVNIIYDGEGGYWFGASRDNNANQPNLVHFDKNGNRDYYSESNKFYGGDGILLHNGMLIKGKARTDAKTGNFGVYTISKDASGNLVLTEKWSVKANHIGRNLNEFAVDYGENLYVVGNSGEKIIAFAMPYSGSVTTPCAAKYAFELEAHGVVKRAVQLGESTIVLTHDADGTPYIYNVIGDVMTPISQNGIVARDPENTGDYLAISDIAVTEDGKLVACNYIMCQSDASKVDAGYKRGVSRFYIWDNLNDNPRVWFTSQMYSNWFRSKQGYTMALKGTSTNAQILTTGANGTNDRARFSVYNVINGVYTEPTTNNNDYYHFHNGPADIYDAATPITSKAGANYELNASPWDNMWIMDGNLIEPYELNLPATNNEALSNGEKLADILGKKYNGATYFTIGNLCFMVAPYADASGKVAGVKLIEIHNGLASAKVVQTLDLATPVTGTAAATAVKVDDFDLAITLVVDATIYTFETTINIEVVVDEDADNTTALAPYEGQRVDKVTVKRHFDPNKCYTLTLPFDMNASQIEDVFGNATVYEFYNIYEQNAEELYLEFIPTSSIQAGEPCLVVTPSGSFDANDGFMIEDVIISTTPQPVQVGAVTMMPVLDNGYLMEDPSEYYVWEGGLYCAGTYKMTSKGLRAYFVSSSPLPVRARVVLKDNEATSIPLVGVETDTQVRKIMKDGQIIIIRGEEQYNIQGQRID